MKHMIFVDKMNKQYEVLRSETGAISYLYEDGFEIYKGSLQGIFKLGLKYYKTISEESQNETH